MYVRANALFVSVFDFCFVSVFFIFISLFFYFILIFCFAL